jgi:hypothetical protein
VAQDPYAVALYKLGDTYYGARSNEFGYANLCRSAGEFGV